MAIEKILNTRIQLRYDEYVNWYNNNPVLKRGEIAIATIPENHTDPSTGVVTQIPAVVIKVGTGAETGSNYRDLPFVSAKAADVLAACKSEAGLKAFINSVIADAGIATNDAMEALAGRVTIVEGEITTLKGDENTAGSVAKTIKDAIDALDLDNTYAAKEHTHVAADITDLDDTIKGYDYATKTELGNVDAKFANYKTAADQKTIDDEQDRRLGVIEGDYLKAADIANFETKDNVKKVADDLAAYVQANDAVIDAMYSNEEIDTAVQGAKNYAKGLVDAIPAQTDYTVTITETTDGLDASIAKKYTFTQNGAEIGTINLAKELVVTSGSVKEVEIADMPYVGAKVGDKYIELVIANQTAPIYIPAKDLVDIYTAKDGAAEVQVAISNINEISATLVNGGVTEEKLAEGVKTKLNKTWEEVGVAKGLVDALAETHAADKTTLEAAIEEAKTEAANQAIVTLAEAQKYTDTTLQNAKDYTDGAINGLGTMANETAADYIKKTEAVGYDDILTKTEAANAYQAKGEYATAEQGAKADSAVQTVKAADGSGFNVTTEGNAVTIDWNYDVVFVFDCGNSVDDNGTTNTAEVTE